MARDALHMRKAWARAEPPTAAVPAPIHIRGLAKSDEIALGKLMWAAFESGVEDDRYDTREDAAVEAVQALAGEWGAVIWAASLAAELDGAIISAVIVVHDDDHQDLPLLAFAMTDPAHQRQRIGQRLIEESVYRLDAIGEKELHLAVTRGNPAFTLYQRLGFRIVPDKPAPASA